MSSYDASVATTYRQLLNDISVDLSGVITRGQTDGTIRSELPAQPVASALTSMVERACTRICRTNRPTTTPKPPPRRTKSSGALCTSKK